VNRRQLFGAGLALPLLSINGLSAETVKRTRYPHPDLITLDPSFGGFLGNTPIEQLYTNTSMYWAEGPAWNGQGNYLVWSDIPNNVQYRWLNEDSHVSVLRNPSNNSNGNTFDLQGRQISFEHLTHRVARYERDGTVTVLAENYG